MNSTLQKFQNLCPDVDGELLNDHLSRLNDRYFETFNETEICRHLNRLPSLSSESPVQVLIENTDNGSVDIIIRLYAGAVLVYTSPATAIIKNASTQVLATFNSVDAYPVDTTFSFTIESDSNKATVVGNVTPSAIQVQKTSL